MKKTYKALVAQTNQVFKRTTARTYTHIVVARRNPEHLIAVENAATDTKYLDFYIARAQGTSKIYDFESPESIARDVARGQEILAAGGKEAYFAQQKVAYEASVRASVARGSFDQYFEDGWCGRLDLAEKKASALRNVSFKGIPAYLDIQILPADLYFGPKK